MERASANILVSELKELIRLLKNLGPEVSLRVRLQGQMWVDDFMNIRSLINYNNATENFTGLILHDERRKKDFIIPDVSRVIQFEIDKPFKTFEPFVHYTVLLFGSENVSARLN
jgi:hypothetical protein